MVISQCTVDGLRTFDTGKR